MGLTLSWFRNAIEQNSIIIIVTFNAFMKVPILRYNDYIVLSVCGVLLNSMEYNVLLSHKYY